MALKTSDGIIGPCFCKDKDGNLCWTKGKALRGMEKENGLVEVFFLEKDDICSSNKRIDELELASEKEIDAFRDKIVKHFNDKFASVKIDEHFNDKRASIEEEDEDWRNRFVHREDYRD